MRFMHQHRFEASHAFCARRFHRLICLVVFSWLAVPGSVLAQQTNEILTVIPNSADQGTSGLLVTFSLDTDLPPAPPSDVMPTVVTIGSISGTSIAHPSQNEVSAVFDIPGAEPAGAKDCVVAFDTPQGTTTFSLVGGFTVNLVADTPPTVTQSPQSRTARIGASVSFSVVASGSEPLSYQWQKNQVDIATATSASYSINSVVEADAGNYRCVVSNAFGSDTSDEATLAVDTTPPSEINSYLIVDTEQVLCYDTINPITCPTAGTSFAGQDAQHQGTHASYVLSADGLTVDDLNTGLTWQHTPDTTGDGSITVADKMTWAQVQARPAALNAAVYGGYDDWRLPTIKEQYSLIDFRGTDPSGLIGNDTSGLTPYIDTNYFEFAYGDTAALERVIDSQYASSTLYVGDTTMLFGVNFADGRIKGYGLNVGGTDKTFLVQCVRGNTSYGTNIFQDNGDGTVTDLATDLQWVRADSGSNVDWQTALAAVETYNASSYLGYDDWRLPNVKELQSILDYTRCPATHASAAIDPVFSATPITNEGGQADYSCYWSSTTHGAYNGTGGSGSYVCFGRALGWMQNIGETCYTLFDVHGAGAQRSDPKTGSVSSYYLGEACTGGSVYGFGPQGDIIRIANAMRLVRGGNGPVVASFGISPVDPSDVTVVTFTATASGALSPYTYAWDLGGSSDTGQVVTGTLRGGTHTISLTVTDAAGFMMTTSQELTVTSTAMIFVDDFETAGTAAWSNTVP